MIGKDGLIYEDKLVTYSKSPGYRDVSLTLELNDGISRKTVEIQLSADDAVTIMQHIKNVNDLAWSQGKRPLDAKEGEQMPVWL